ncbi:MAG: PqqD family protein [Candidatus Dechloromonas phosphoritropha]|jgi:hypothetical protein
MELADKVTIPTQVMAREVGEEIVILDLAGGSYFGLDPVGARIWELMSEGRTLGEICATMLEEYEVTAEQLQGDVIKLAGELAERGLVLKA